MSTLLILFIIVYIVLVIIRLDWAVMLMLFCLPVYQIRFSVFGLPSTLLEAMILASFAFWLARNYKIIFENLKLKIKHCLKIENCELKIGNRYPFDIEIALLLVISFAAAGVAGFSDSALGIWKAYFFEPILIYILIFNVFQSKKETGKIYFSFEKIIWPLAFSAFFISLVAILQKVGFIYSPANFWPRVTGVFPYPNALGLYLGPLIVLLTGYLAQVILNRFADRRRSEESQESSRLAYNQRFFANTQNDNEEIISIAAVIIISIVSVIFAGSEGALAGVLVAGAVMAIFYLAYRFKNRVLSNLGKIAVGAILVFVILSPFFFLKMVPENKYFDFHNQALNYISDKVLLKDFSGEVRKQQWRETWEMMTKNPRIFIFGTGLAGYQERIKPYHQEGIFFNSERDPRFYNELVWGAPEYKARHWRPVEIYMYPHNVVLNFVSELGIFGAVLIIWIFIKLLAFSFKLLDEGKENKFLFLGLSGAFIVILVHGIVDAPYFKNDLAIMFWIFVAMAGIMNLELKINKK